MLARDDTAPPRSKRRPLTPTERQRVCRARVKEGRLFAPPAKKLSRGAEYTRAWRRRLRDGRILLRLECVEADLVIALVGRGLLNPLVADDRASIATATEKLLAQVCEREVSLPAEQIDASVRIGLLLRALRNASNDRRRAKRRARTRGGELAGHAAAGD